MRHSQLLRIGSFSFLAILFATVVTPLSVSAQANTIAIAASPGTVEIGEPITVVFTSGAPAAVNSSDMVLMVDEATDTVVAQKSIGLAPVTFISRLPGTYVFKYRPNTAGFPVLATSNRVTVTLPNPGNVQLSASPALVEIGQPINVNFTLS